MPKSKKHKKRPCPQTFPEYVKQQLKDIEIFISDVEHQYNVQLIGERMSLEMAYEDIISRCISRTEVKSLLDEWKTGINSRYNMGYLSVNSNIPTTTDADIIIENAEVCSPENYIKNSLLDFNDIFINSVINGFNFIVKYKEPNCCLQSSISLLVCAKYCGYDAQLCYGLCKVEDFEFYHAWLEINNRVIDVAIYGNANYSPYYKGKKLEFPIINKEYSESPVSYGKFVFDNDWNGAMISQAEGMSIQEYLDFIPNDILWKFICDFLNITYTNEIKIKLANLVKGLKIEVYNN